MHLHVKPSVLSFVAGRPIAPLCLNKLLRGGACLIHLQVKIPVLSNRAGIMYAPLLLNNFLHGGA